MPLPVVVLNGATASGKTSAAVAVARGLAARGLVAEVINADAMLVYRGMDIGTAKPTLVERGGVPHHLLDFLDVTEVATVADFQVRARAQINDCRERGVVPLLVGGSALYVRAIVDEFAFPPSDPDLRARLEAEAEAVGSGELWRRLHAFAPEQAALVEPGNTRRIVRALEIWELTGSVATQLPSNTYALDNVVQLGLHLERDAMDDRISRRVEAMWEAGFVDEVVQLIGVGLRDGVTASRAIGYRQILDLLDGECDESQAKESTITRTRRFSRKQLSWFRRDERIRWFPALSPTLATDLVDAVCAASTNCHDRRLSP